MLKSNSKIMIKKLVPIMLCFAIFACLTAGCTFKPFQLLSSGENHYEIGKISKHTVKGNTTFAFDIFRQVNKEDRNKNIFISPLSISTALTMTYQGAKTTTKEAMAKALGYSGIENEELNGSYKNLLRYLAQVDNKVELNIGNSIWIRDGEEIEESFITINKDIFKALAKELDFSKASAVDEINKWISDATENKIEKMIEPPISPDVVMYLINAIYFKGDWSRQFDPKRTYDAQFNEGSGDTGGIKMMSLNGEVEYGQGNGFKAVRLPYGKGRTAMYCILPDETADINKYIDGFDQELWEEIKGSISESDDVQLRLPRFKLEYGIKNLNDSLEALGMGEAFTCNADFSGIREGIFISRVLHKAVIEVNEEGSEAAAATVVEMREIAAAEPLTFIADRPFIFIIADDETGTILFMGKLYELLFRPPFLG